MRGRSCSIRGGPLLLLWAALAGCFGDAVEPVRDLVVQLESPNGRDAAAVIELVGPGLSDVVATNGQVFTHVSGDTTRVVILLDEPGPIEFTVRMAGLTFPGTAVVQVADDRDELRSLRGYRARLGSAGSRPR